MTSLTRTLLLLAFGFSLSFAQAQTFPEWQSGVFTTEELADPAISGANADPDGDSRANLIEYAFGLDPLISDQDASSFAAGPNGLTLTYPELIAATDLLYHFQESTRDLKNWVTPNTTNRTILSDDGVLRMVSVYNPNAPATPDRWFNRLHLFVSPGAVEDLFPPSNPTATLEVPLTVVLGWNDNTKIEDGFYIERRVGTGGAWEAIGTTPADTNTFEDIHIVGSTDFAYRVSALQGTDASESSAEVTITTPLDIDGDGIPDDMEASYNTDPLLFSSGNNGTSDGWWIRYGLNPYSSSTQDSDGDGRSDSQEFLDGTDPLTPDAAPPTPDVAAPSDLVEMVNADGSSDLKWHDNSNNEKTFIIQEQLPDGTWVDIATVSPNTTTFHIPSAQQ